MALVRPGFVHYATFPNITTPEALNESIGLITSNGFEVVELSSLLEPHLLERAAQLLRDAGATLFLSAGPEFVRTRRSLCDLRVEARIATIGRVSALIDLGASLGAANLMLASGADPGVDRRADARAALVDSLRRIADLAGGRSGCRITVETFPRDRGPAQLLGPTVETLAVLDEVGAGALGVTVDLSHLVQLNEDVAVGTASLASRSTHMHLSTCVLTVGHSLEGDQHPTFDEPGIALTLSAAAGVVRHFAANDRVVSVEMRRHHSESAESFVTDCARYLRAAVGETSRLAQGQIG